MIVVTISAVDGSVAAKHSHLREMGVPILFGAVVLLVSATLLLGGNISALYGSLRLLDHSQKVLTRISELETGILGQELTVRGYALTGDASFLRMQREGGRRRELARAELTRLMAAEPQRAAEFGRIMNDVARHVKTFDAFQGIGPDRAQLIARAIVDPNIRTNMRRTRDGLATLRSEEMRDIADHQGEMAGQIARAFFLAVGIILVAFLLGGIGVWTAQIKGPLKR